MSAKVDIQVLINEIEKRLSVYSRIFDYYSDFMKKRLDKKRKRPVESHHQALFSSFFN